MSENASPYPPSCTASIVAPKLTYPTFAFDLGNVKDSSGSGATMVPVTAPGVLDQAQEISPILADLIKASQMWTSSSPSWEDEVEEFKRGLFSADTSSNFALYCYFMASFDDPACTQLTDTNPHIDFSILDMPEMTYTPETKY
uniref:Uncharacterized protein n=1 Tax=Globisporangium ultimum (strain ATCC 200006 / CBS 805.95 / DAOM BR144) TaxID=431595 RepID=K3X981_GLOUD